MDDNDDLELRDLGDAMEETKQGFMYPRFPDNEFVFGWWP
jgi:hypothetical protein